MGPPAPVIKIDGPSSDSLGPFFNGFLRGPECCQLRTHCTAVLSQHPPQPPPLMRPNRGPTDKVGTSAPPSASFRADSVLCLEKWVWSHQVFWGWLAMCSSSSSRGSSDGVSSERPGPVGQSILVCRSSGFKRCGLRFQSDSEGF